MRLLAGRRWPGLALAAAIIVSLGMSAIERVAAAPRAARKTAARKAPAKKAPARKKTREKRVDLERERSMDMEHSSRKQGPGPSVQ